MSAITASIVVPTYMRPDYLERCVCSLFSQTKVPNEIVLVSRFDDEPTNQKIKELQKKYAAKVPILNSHVYEPGFLPPIKKGIEVASYDVVVFLDDDTETLPDWLNRMLVHYQDKSIGGVGGRCINYFDFKLVQYKKTSKVAKLSWYGRSVGNMYKDTTFEHPVPADFFMGGNMSFRRDLLLRIAIDPVINKNVAFHWELDLAQQVKKLGVNLVFDPLAKVKHYSAPRDTDGLRSVNYEGVFYSNYNYTYLMMKHLVSGGKFVFLLYSFIIGSQHASGLIHLIVQLLRCEKIYIYNDLVASVYGRIKGLIAYFNCKKSRNGF